MKSNLKITHISYSTLLGFNILSLAINLYYGLPIVVFGLNILWGATLYYIVVKDQKMIDSLFDMIDRQQKTMSEMLSTIQENEKASNL